MVNEDQRTNLVSGGHGGANKNGASILHSNGDSISSLVHQPSNGRAKKNGSVETPRDLGQDREDFQPLHDDNS